MNIHDIVHTQQEAFTEALAKAAGSAKADIVIQKVSAGKAGRRRLLADKVGVDALVKVKDERTAAATAGKLSNK